MSKRISNENLPDEVLKMVQESGDSGVTASLLYESMVALHWDFGSDDLNESTGSLMGNELVYYTLDGKLKLTEAGKKHLLR